MSTTLKLPSDGVNPPVHIPTLHPLGHLPGARHDLLGLFDRARDTGPVVNLRMAHKTVTIVSTPTAAHHVLVAKANQYKKTTRGYEILRVLLGQGLVTAEDELWRRQRRIANPAFRRKAVAGFVDAMSEATQAWLDSLPAEPTTLDIAHAMHRLTLGIAGTTLMSRDLSASGDEIGDALETVLPGFSQLTKSILPRPWLWPIPATRRFMSAVHTLDRVVHGIIAERRRDPDNHPDLLGMLMVATDPETGEHMSDTQLRDEVLTMLLAGHETTANAMAWTLYLLAQHPEWAERVRDEVLSVAGDDAIEAGHIPKLQLTSRVFDESLRIYSPIWVNGRQAHADDVIDGVAIPKGRMVFIHTYGIHRHPDYWDHPTTFDPDRFLPERKASIVSGSYHPFSMGQRKCIGDRFARTEGITLLAMMVRALHVTTTGADVVPEPSLTLRPRNGLPLRIARR